MDQSDRTFQLSILAGVISAVWLAIPVLHSSGVYLGSVGFWGEPLVWGAYLVVAVAAILIARSRTRLLPLVIVSLAFLIYATDLERAATLWNFQSRLQRRLEVVRLIERGEIVETRDAIALARAADLPERYRTLSAGGYVLVTRHAQGFSVTFYVDRVGMFDDDDYTAFVYRSGEGQPENEVEDTSRFSDVQTWQPHWFFVRHT